MVGVEQWAEVRRMARVEGLSARGISRRTRMWNAPRPDPGETCFPRKPGKSAPGRRCASRRQSGFVWPAPRWGPPIRVRLAGQQCGRRRRDGSGAARSGVSVGRRPHRFGNDGLLVRVGALRIGPALLGEDDERRECVGVLDDVGAVGSGDDEVANGCVGAVDQAVGTCLAPRECDDRAGRQELCPVRPAQPERPGEDEQWLLVGVVDVQRRADDARVEFVDTGAEFPGPGLSAHGSDMATRESVRIPDRLREVNGHRPTVADLLDAPGRKRTSRFPRKGGKPASGRRCSWHPQSKVS